MSTEEIQVEKSEKWLAGKREVEAHGVEWDEQRKSELRLIQINVLRKIAAELRLDTTGSKEELIQRLIENNCFRGPVGDDTVYCEVDGRAIPLVGIRGSFGYRRWEYLQDSSARTMRLVREKSQDGFTEEGENRT